jgi:hypothetical protein
MYNSGRRSKIINHFFISIAGLTDLIDLNANSYQILMNTFKFSIPIYQNLIVFKFIQPTKHQSPFLSFFEQFVLGEMIGWLRILPLFGVELLAKFPCTRQ